MVRDRKQSVMMMMLCHLISLLVVGLPYTFSQQPEPGAGSGDYRPPTVWNVYKYPDPSKDFIKCGRNAKSSVCDPNGVISVENANVIDRVIDGVRNETRCMCYDCVQGKRGYIIKVAILLQMENILDSKPGQPDQKLKDAQIFAYQLSHRWNFVGSCNETILIVYSKLDNILYTLTRQHAHMHLPDSSIVEVSMNTRHYFEKNETIADGIIQTILGYKSILQGEEYVPQFAKVKDNDDNSGLSLASTSSIILVYLISLVALIF